MMTKINKFLCALCALCAVGFVACNEDDIPDNFYSSTKVTAAGFIKADDAQFSDFRTILTRANYLSMLDTYGTYTVFVPTNDAVSRYLADNGYASVADLPVEQCDTLARTHIVKTQALFTTDIDNSSMPMNMNDRYLELSTDSDVMNNNALIVYVNKNARIIQKDDSVTNGVVHVVDHMLTASNQFLPDLMEEDPQLTIFCQALRLTGMADSISRYLDETYTCGDDSVTKGVKVKYSTASDGSANLLTAYFPEKRLCDNDVLEKTSELFYCSNELVIFRAVHKMCRLDNDVLGAACYCPVKSVLYVVDDLAVSGIYMVDDDLGCESSPYCPLRISFGKRILDALDISYTAVVEGCTEAYYKEFVLADLILVAGIVKTRVACISSEIVGFFNKLLLLVCKSVPGCLCGFAVSICGICGFLYLDGCDKLIYISCCLRICSRCIFRRIG